MLHPPPAAAASSELLTQFVDMDTHRPLLHDSQHHALQPLDSIVSQYDSEFMTQSMMATDSTLADSEMVSTGTDMGLPDFGFPSLDVTMTDDAMAMPDLLNISTLSTDIAHLTY